ncbi:hypothetical protein NIES4073_37140 [Kalymmatonema gypsitolerans NIES-4073]|nr:hypothetical protein NIES4073_37140 [Scytonema sp. NIES-4073]
MAIDFQDSKSIPASIAVKESRRFKGEVRRNIQIQAAKIKRGAKIVVQQVYFMLWRNPQQKTADFILHTLYFQWLLAQWRVINYFYQNYREISVFDSTDEIN